MKLYRGRFAPTPSGPLHAGSIVAALASYLDARAHGGLWSVRIEDIDAPRCVAGADAFILHQLDRLGLRSPEPVVWQSQRSAHYEAAWGQLQSSGWAYGCACSRQDIEQALTAAGVPRARHAMAVYPGTCRNGLHGKAARAWRVRVEGSRQWTDRRLGRQSQHLDSEVGDFIIRRADTIWAYQLAVVVDDAVQGITDVVRGEDLADNTPRQQFLQDLLGVPRPRYLHTPLVLAEDGQKLSKQTGAQAVDLTQGLTVLQAAARILELEVSTPDEGRSASGLQAGASGPEPKELDRWLELAAQAWARRWLQTPGTHPVSPTMWG